MRLVMVPGGGVKPPRAEARRIKILLSAGLSSAAGLILKSVVLIPVADPLFGYAALQRPSIYHVLVWSYGAFLFTTPFLMLSVCLSFVYIHERQLACSENDWEKTEVVA